ncbi:3-carboxy-cis,cis-muconate cycloisomerase [Fulvimarina sp. MAC3]|uniref:3-carboxy-cis,cis-muconate cycloisomerase n=1 Tax=Fulvimarina sp. MAC3 TaxID=3148887 RepID=UPI0031FC8651
MTPLLTSLTGDCEIAAFFEPEAEIKALLRVEAALAGAQGSSGVIAPAAAKRIEAACRNLLPDETALREGLERDGVVIPTLVRALRMAADDAGDKVHLGATSQDIIDSGLMLRIRSILILLDERVERILGALERHERHTGAHPLMAQTRMQAALPFTVRDKLETWAHPLRAHRLKLAAVSKSLPIQLGGPIGDGSSLGVHYEAIRAGTAGRLELRDAPPWHSDRTPILEIGQALMVLTGTLGKIGQDIALMSQSGVRSVQLAGGGGSSAMAHKNNPVGAELLVALARHAAGLLGTLSQAMVHENERSGAAWTLEWMVLPQLCETAGAATARSASLLGQMQFGP